MASTNVPSVPLYMATYLRALQKTRFYIEHENMCRRLLKADADEYAEEQAFHAPYPYLEYAVPAPKERKTRADILTPAKAIMVGKNSKDHKLAPRTERKDRTKTKEAKAHTKAKRSSHAPL